MKLVFFVKENCEACKNAKEKVGFFLEKWGVADSVPVEAVNLSTADGLVEAAMKEVAEIPTILLVDGGDPASGVHDEQDQPGLAHRGVGLSRDLLGEGSRGARCQPPGVDQPERNGGFPHLAVEAILGNSGFVRDDRRAAADEPVEERALAHVGGTDDGDERVPHAANLARRRDRPQGFSGAKYRFSMELERPTP